jgi:hypothetical protein
LKQHKAQQNDEATKRQEAKEINIRGKNSVSERR